MSKVEIDVERFVAYLAFVLLVYAFYATLSGIKSDTWAIRHAVTEDEQGGDRGAGHA